MLLIDNQNMLAEQYNDEQLAITLLILGTGSITFHFWHKKDGRYITDDILRRD